MADIVLVHGTYAGGFIWRAVADMLRSRGHRVWTPTLTGLGERRHLNAPGVGLGTHISDIEGVLFYEDVHDAVIVGFSYGGMVLAGLSEQATTRIAATVLLDAAFPEDGEAIHDVYAHVDLDTLPDEVAELHARPRQLAFEPDLAVPPWAQSDPRFTPMPADCHWDAVTRGPLFDARPGYYIRASQWTMNSRCAQRAAATGWTVWEIDTPHGAMDADPAGLAELIDRAARETVALTR